MSVTRALLAAMVSIVAVAAMSAWVLATEHRATVPAIAAVPRADAKWPLTAPRVHRLRTDALRRAQVRVAPPAAPAFDHDVLEAPFTCRFVADLPSGTSPKFDCMVDTGEVVKVKYGRNPEVAAEVAATRLVAALGYPADRMTISPRVRCYGCPRDPFFAMRLVQFAGLHDRFPAHGRNDGYTDFEWVAVERKFDGAAIELPTRKGWGWWELNEIDPARGASRADQDALRLLAMFLVHWDNKDENQRLVCLDEPAGADRPCERPLAMIQDLGATFGPPKANLARWRDAPLWADRADCEITMSRLAVGRGSFPDARITEAGRLQLARQLAAIPPDDIRALFRSARFPERYSATDDEKDLDAWQDAFLRRVDRILSGGPCPS